MYACTTGRKTQFDPFQVTWLIQLKINTLEGVKHTTYNGNIEFNAISQYLFFNTWGAMEGHGGRDRGFNVVVWDISLRH